MRIGVTIRLDIGIGDKLQFSSLPENYFRGTGQKIVDLSRPWFWDYNPYVDRETPREECSKVIELWNFPTKYKWPEPFRETTQSEREKGPKVYLSNAEIWASLVGVPTVLNRPRLYRFEDFPFAERTKILFHTHGRSHGTLPNHVIEHVIRKYKPTGHLYHVGLPSDPDFGIPKITTRDYWELAELISQARMFIGIDSGPSWIAACYPDVVIKKIRNKDVHGWRKYPDWIPLEINNHHSHWDDRLFQIYRPSEDDVGFMQSYKKL